MRKRAVAVSDLDANRSSQLVSGISLLGLYLTVKLFIWFIRWILAAMAGVPQGAFAARKVRQACEAGRLWKQNLSMDEGLPLEERFHLAEAAMEQPMQYSSKLMNSIWGLYNRYSVHNFKKNTDGTSVFLKEQQLNAVVPRSPLNGMFQNQ